MNCIFDKQIIQKYADNTIDPLEFVFLKEHINYCEECRNEMELVMALENGLEKFFIEDPGIKDLDLMITSLVDDCMYEISKREKLKYALKKGMKLGNGIVENSIRFIDYIPGNKSISKGAQKTVSGVGSFITTLIKKKAVKLFAGAK